MGFNGRSTYADNAYRYLTDGTQGEIIPITLHTTLLDNGKFMAIPLYFSVGANY